MAAENVQTFTDSNFDETVLKAGTPVLVDFWAEWCAPCRAIAPAVAAVAEKYSSRIKVVKLNVDEGVDTSSRYWIKGIPTLILFRDGREVERVVGTPANAKEFLSSILDKHLSTDADARTASAAEA